MYNFIGHLSPTLAKALATANPVHFIVGYLSLIALTTPVSSVDNKQTWLTDSNMRVLMESIVNEPAFGQGPASSLLQSESLSIKSWDLVNQVDTWPYFQQDTESYRQFMEDYYYFMVEGYKSPLGYAHKSFVTVIEWQGYWSLDHEKRILILSIKGGFTERTDAMQKTLKQGHQDGKVECLRKWGDEVLPVIYHNGDHLLNMDLCGVDIFGIRTFGVHLTAYVRTNEGLKYWVPRRAKTKTPYAGMLDNTVAANLFSGQKPLEKLIQRAADEASIPAEYTARHANACGTVTYQMTWTNEGKPGCQHHVQYVYEMELAPHMVPSPFNGDVETFKLMTLGEVAGALERGEFNFRAMTWVAHFIRHGIVNPENEPNIIDVCARLHRKHDLFVV